MKYLLLILFSFCRIFASGQNADLDLLKAINKSSSSFKNSYAHFSSDAVTPIAIGLPIGIGIAGIVKKDDQLKKDALFMAGSYIGNVIITQSLKRIIQRKRPYETHSFIIQRASEDNGRSFPSGHTSNAFATATSVALRYRKWYYVVPAYALAASAGWSRMYMGVHYPTDVLAGAILGSGCAWLGFKLEKKFNLHKPPPNPRF